MTTQHTPGPWQYNGYADHCDVGRPYHEIVDETGFEVINQNGILDGQDGEGEAYARLIAAAPELLEACQAMAYEPRPWVDDVQGRKDALVYMNIVKAAIAKALGEEVTT